MNLVKTQRRLSRSLVETLKKYFGTDEHFIAAYLFGSRAKGKEQNRSDLDIAVLFKPEKNFGNFSDFEVRTSIELEKLLEDSYNIDLRVLNFLPLSLQYHIISLRKRLLIKDEVFCKKYEAIIAQKYLDFSYSLKIFDKIMYRKIKYGK